jgi:hypothetical protein
MDDDALEDLSRRAASISPEDLAKAVELAKQDWTAAVRFIAPRHGVDADELLRKAPRLPVNPFDPGQFRAYVAEMELKASDDMTEAEVTVCMLAHQMVVQITWEVIKNKFPNLPEFKEHNERDK